MDIHNYLISIDLDYRNMIRQIKELESRDDLNENEKRDLDDLKKLIEEKQEEIELGR